jgi:hypothetical protein
VNPPAAPPLAHSFTHPQVIIANGHFVVLGWSERTLFLLAEAAQMLSDRDEQGGEIVVLTELDEQQMLSEVNIVYPDWRKRWPNVVLRYMQGKPYEIADLMRVSVFAAHHVMVLGLSRRPREADSQVITMLCALRCLPISMSPQCLVVAEMRQSQAKSVARQLFISTGEEESAEVLPVAAAQAVDALLVMCTVSPLAGRALMGLMSFAGDQVEIVRAAGSGGVLIGRSFGEARRCFPKGVLIGLIRSEEYLTNDAEGEDDNDEQLNETGVAAKDSVYRDRERVRLAPPDEELILASDSLVVLAEDQADAAEGLQGVAQAVRRDSTIPTTRWASISLASIGKIAVSMSNLSPTSKTKAAFAIPSKDDPDATPPATPTRAPAPSPAAACAAAAAHAAHAASASAAATFAASTSAAAFASASARTAAVTCAATASAAATSAAATASAASLSAASLFAATAPAPPPPLPDNFSPPLDFGETPVTILIIGWSLNLPSLLHAFDTRLAPGSQAFILGHISMAERSEDLAAEGLDIEGNELRPGGAAAETSSDSAHGLRNVQLNHVVGFETDYLALRRLPVRRADLALIIADAVQSPGLAMSGWSEPQMNDSGAMTSSILLRRLRDEVTAGLEGAARPPPLQVVTQLADVLTYRLLRKTPGLLNTRSSADSNCADTLDFHRNYMETTTVSVAANNSDAWSALRTLIYPAGGSELAAIPVADALPVDQLLPTPAAAAACAEEQGLSFWEIGERVRQLGLGVLVGWHRVPRHTLAAAHRGKLSGTLHSLYTTRVAAPKHTLFVNPVDKDMPLTWCRHDRLLVVRTEVTRPSIVRI